MRRTDIEAVGELAGEALAAGGGLIREMHLGIAGRPLGILGPAAAPVRVVHDAVSDAVYGGVRRALGASSRAGARLVARAADEEDAPLAARVGGSLALGALNGFYGDFLHERGSELALRMTVRRDGADVDLTPETLASTFGDAGPRVAVFLHGLCETDEAWSLLGGGPSYGERLHADLGFTPVHVRYNTGLRISANGRALAGVLEELVAAWPTGVEELALVGHSMGGLVARSACHYGALDGRGWTDVVRHVFCLGTPHLGADLERGANALGWLLGRLPETRALAMVVNARSAGIKDLRYGSCTDEDWCDCDPDEFLRDRCQEVPFLPGAAYYFVGATLSRGPLGSLLGDLLVRSPSASGRGNGRGRSIPFEVDNGFELDGLTHFDLLSHPAVYEQIRGWIARGEVAVAA